MNLIQRLSAAYKAFNQGDWVNSDLPGTQSRGTSGLYARFEPQTNVNYGGIVGDIWSNSAVQAVLNKVIMAWPESYPCVKEKDAKTGKKVELHYPDTHPLIDLLEYPSDADDDTVLWAGTILSFWADGNAYWGINRTRRGDIGEFVYLPHMQVTPKIDQSYDPYNPDRATSGPDYFEYYDYRGYRQEIEPRNIVHFKFGKNPRYPLCGLAPWASVARHVFTDNEAINYVGETLGNGGSAWMIASPSDPQSQFDDPDAVKDKIMAATGRGQRGSVLVLNGGVKLDAPPTMKDTGIEHFHRIPETRICALAGFHPMWIGLASGLERATYNNSDQADEQGWNTIVAAQRMMGRQLTQQVLRRPGNFSDYERANSTRRFYAGFDYSEVRALQPDKVAEWTRVVEAVAGGIIDVDEGRAEIGYEPYTAKQLQAQAERQAAALAAAMQSNPQSGQGAGNNGTAGKGYEFPLWSSRIDKELAAIEASHSAVPAIAANGNGVGH